jgi:transcriptional regulator
MYIPELYKNENEQEINDFLKNNSFGILVNRTNGKLWATHIPLELDISENGRPILFGHISKENPQWHGFESDAEVLAIFTGPHTYISSSWYEKENVPTWNYIAVHIYGTVKIVEGDAVIESLKKLMEKYERHSENPVRIEALSPQTMRQAHGIVAFEIEIENIEAVKKMSQNRNEKDFNAIISQLEKSRNHEAMEVAKAMKRCPF